MEEQLGYECQPKKWLPKTCSQPRIKADVLFEQIAEWIQQRIPKLTKREFQQYVLFVHLFLKKKKAEAKQDKGRVAQTLKQLTLERRRLLDQRVELIAANEYDKHSKADYETRISELAEAIENLQTQKNEATETQETKFRSFIQFLELKRNLHQYWIAANMNQKEQISKNLLSNLIVDGQVIRSTERISPLWEAENQAFFSIGEAQGVVLEPKFQELWERFQDPYNADKVRKLTTLNSELSTAMQPVFSLEKHMRDLSGTI